MRLDVMSMTVTSRLQASPVSGVPSAAARAVINVPAPSGFRELRMRTGMLRSTAGRIVLGCSTLAPKYASSAASANDSCGTRRGERDDARIGAEHAVHVGPDLNLARADAGADERAGIIRAAAPERRGVAIDRRADESAKHRHAAARRESAAPVLRSAALVSAAERRGARVVVVGDDGAARIHPVRRARRLRSAPPPRCAS